jgi:hypothetical protein
LGFQATNRVVNGTYIWILFYFYLMPEISQSSSREKYFRNTEVSNTDRHVGDALKLKGVAPPQGDKLGRRR